MKINKLIRNLYQELNEKHQLLEERVKLEFEARKQKKWFFFSRIKEEESFALKLETGRVANPGEMDDFFACTLVVENRLAISAAVAVIEEICDVVKRRPANDNETHKSPHEFSFDDLRMYVKLKESDQLPPTPLNELIFEVQVKTFLQHAWGIATHDLVYKGQSVNWGRARVAYQIKAMLEHAEVSIEGVDSIAGSSVLKQTDERTHDVTEIISWLITTWDADGLPSDMVRLAENIYTLSKAIGITTEEVIDSVKNDTDKGEGAALRDLTPYSVVIRGIYNHHQLKLANYLKREKGRFKLFFSEDSDFSEKLKDIQGARPEKFVYLTQPKSNLVDLLNDE
jgi:ppGpp synthetase/RelA/SpoT-type nucleotidyltranferase